MSAKHHYTFLRESLFAVALTAAVAGVFVAILRTSSPPLLTALVALQAILTIQAVMLFHDCLHFAAFRSPRANTWLGRWIGGFFFWPLSYLRESHLSHHRHAGLVENDPEALHLGYEDASRYPAGHLLHRLGRSRLGILLYTPCIQAAHFSRWLSKHAVRSRDGRRIRGLAMDAAATAAFWVPLNLWLGSQGLATKGFLLGFLVPSVLAMMAVYCISKPLHTGMLPRVPSGLPKPDRVLLVSRTFDAHPVLRVLFCNLCYHIEHHLHPTTSRWELGRLSRRIRPSLRDYARERGLPLVTHRSYLRWTRDFRRHGARYNPIRSREDLFRHNAVFEHSS